MAQVQTRKFGGDIRLWKRGDAGVLTPVIPEAADPQGNQPIEANVMTFAYDRPDPENITSKRRGNRYGQIVTSVQEPGTSSCNITLLEVPDSIVQRLVHGLGTITDVVGGSVSAGTLDLPANKTLPIKLPHKNLSASPAPVIENEAGDKTYVVGDDYRLDLVHGLLIIPSGSDIITDAETKLTVSYTYGGYRRNLIAGGGAPTEGFFITGDMEDRETGANGLLTIPHAELGVTNDVDWFSDTIIQPELGGNIIMADGYDAPYLFDLVTAAT
jgi:hypothetical protein